VAAEEQLLVVAEEQLTVLNIRDALSSLQNAPAGTRSLALCRHTAMFAMATFDSLTNLRITVTDPGR
jgi:hypothetical protein